MLKKVVFGSLVSASCVNAMNVAVSSVRTADWGSGYCEDVTVRNITSNPNIWEAVLNVNGTVDYLWSAGYTQVGNLVTVHGADYNTKLGINESTTFGYCATRAITEESSDLTVTTTVTSDWGSGYCADIRVFNYTDLRVKWSISLPIEGGITNLWDAQYTQDGNLTLNARGKDYNEIVLPGTRAKFGFCADRSIKPVAATMGDRQSVVADSDALTFESIRNYNSAASEIKTNLALPVSGENDTNITWSSSDPSVISHEGIVIQPQGGAKSVTLSAMISKGVESRSKTFDLTVPADTLMNDFNVGFGGSYSFPFLSETDERIWLSSVDLVMDGNITANSYYRDIRNFQPDDFTYLSSKLQNGKFIVYWVTKGWQVSWFDRVKIQKAMDAGFIPVFSYWYFGDDLVSSMPNDTQILEYRQDNLRFAEFLGALKGRMIVVMEPEFNKEVVVSEEANQLMMASILSDAIDTIKASNPNALFTLSMMDTGNRASYFTFGKCGYENCSLGDKDEWSRPEIVYNALLEKLDFISFQQNLAQFSRNPHNPLVPISYTDSDLGIENIAQRIINFTRFLSEKYHKPVFMPFVTVATATWDDANDDGIIDAFELDYQGWEYAADHFYSSLAQAKDTLQAAGLFGYIPMALFDNPMHDFGGYQFFLNNEYHLGLVASNVVDGIDNGLDGDLIFKGNVLEYIYGSGE